MSQTYQLKLKIMCNNQKAVKFDVPLVKGWTLYLFEN